METAIRLIGAALGLYVLVRGGLRARALWAYVPAERRLLWVALLLFAAAAVHGLLEALVLSIPFGPRTFSVFAACAVGSIAVSLPEPYRTDDRA